MLLCPPLGRRLSLSAGGLSTGTERAAPFRRRASMDTRMCVGTVML